MKILTDVCPAIYYMSQRPLSLFLETPKKTIAWSIGIQTTPLSTPRTSKEKRYAPVPCSSAVNRDY